MSDVLVDSSTNNVGQKQNNKSPMVRFDGFTDDWEQRKFGEVVDTRRGLTYKPMDVSTDGVRVLRSSNINDDTFLLKDDDVFVNAEAINIPLVKDGDIIVTAANGSSRLVGKHAIINHIQPNTVHGGFMLIIETKQNTFINAWMSSLEYKKILQLVQGGNGAIGNLSKSVLDKGDITLPSVKEQAQIGNMFKQLDETIALHQRKLDVLSNMKQTFLQKMFPKKGSSVPEIRLDGFIDDWEERKLGDVLSHEIKGKAQKDKLSNGFVEYLDANYLNGSDPILCDSDIDVEYGDILVLWDGSKAGTVYNGFRGVLGSTLKAYKVNEYNDSSFIYQWLSLNQGIIYNQYRTPNIPHVVKNFTSIFSVFVPSLEEQQKIGSFFNTMDGRIESQQTKIKQLQEMKNALLQRMFV